MSTQLELVFDTTWRQLDIPFTQWVSENFEENKTLKEEIWSRLLSKSDLLTNKARLETVKQALIEVVVK